MDILNDILERQVSERPAPYIGKYFKRLKVIPLEEWAHNLDEALDEGIITQDERLTALTIDLIVRAQKINDNLPTIVVVEVSHTVSRNGVEKVLKGSHIFYKVYKMQTIPVVVAVNIQEQLKEEFKTVLFIEVIPE